MTPEFALSIKQPWAWLICKGFKDIENRTWKIGRKSQHGPYSSYHQANFTVELPCRIYIHAGKNLDQVGMDYLLSDKSPLKNWSWQQTPDQFGAIIGEVDIIACITESKSLWFEGKYGFVLANPVLYVNPIPCRGYLGFFKSEISHEKEPRSSC